MLVKAADVSPSTAAIFRCVYALPILGLILVFTAPAGKTHVIGVSIVVCVLALLVGALSTALTAGAIGTPLRGLVDASSLRCVLHALRERA